MCLPLYGCLIFHDLVFIVKTVSAVGSGEADRDEFRQNMCCIRAAPKLPPSKLINHGVRAPSFLSRLTLSRSLCLVIVSCSQTALDTDGGTLALVTCLHCDHYWQSCESCVGAVVVAMAVAAAVESLQSARQASSASAPSSQPSSGPSTATSSSQHQEMSTGPSPADSSHHSNIAHSAS